MAQTKEEKARKSAATHPLIGKWFHAFDERGGLKWQGKVLNETRNGFHVMTVDWLMGCFATHRYVSAKEMQTWDFYGSSVHCREALMLRDAIELNLISDAPALGHFLARQFQHLKQDMVAEICEIKRCTERKTK